jgi:tetratricopeptide (TPR) repeat protein
MILDKAAGIFVSLRKYREAEPLYKRAISLREEWAKDPTTPPEGNKDFLQFLVQATTSARVKLADAYQNLAALYLTERRFDEAEPLSIKSSKALESEFGADAPPFAASQSRLATLYALQGKYEKAEPLYAHAVSVFEKSNWLDKAEAAITFENYSLLLRKTGREPEAARMFEKARAIRARLQRNSN